MTAREVRDLLQQLQRGIGQPSVALECHCENLETVYVSLTQANELLITDQGRTFAYLDRGTDTTYCPMEEFDMVAAAETCRRLGIMLKHYDLEKYPSIECVVAPEGAVADMVAQVSEAVDRVFEIARREDLR